MAEFTERDLDILRGALDCAYSEGMLGGTLLSDGSWGDSATDAEVDGLLDRLGIAPDHYMRRSHKITRD